MYVVSTLLHDNCKTAAPQAIIMDCFRAITLVFNMFVFSNSLIVYNNCGVFIEISRVQIVKKKGGLCMY